MAQNKKKYKCYQKKIKKVSNITNSYQEITKHKKAIKIRIIGIYKYKVTKVTKNKYIVHIHKQQNKIKKNNSIFILHDYV